MNQYIHDNTDDEFSRENFINAYLASKGADILDLEPFRTLPGNTATGSTGKPRLTNLMKLTVDTSWWTRYRSRTILADSDGCALAATRAQVIGCAFDRNRAMSLRELHFNEREFSVADIDAGDERVVRHGCLPREGLKDSCWGARENSRVGNRAWQQLAVFHG
jgi:hypothetical protein